MISWSWVRTSLAISVVCLAASCVQPESVPCADGTVCPRDRACWLIGDSYQCVSDEQIVACDGKADLATCAGGTCLGGVCLAPSCGDGRIGPIEVCDDGNTTSGDGCSPDCRSDETCGNGIVDLQVGEQCDDGETGGGLSHDGCSSGCLEERAEWRVIPDIDEIFAIPTSWSTAYDLARGRVLVVARSQARLSTLESEAGTWTDVSPAVSPAIRVGFALAYDAERRRTVMFGGLGLRETWEWDGSRWLLRQPANSPPARAMHAMAYDPIGRRVVLFGGRSGLANTASELDDTWTWDGTDWTQLAGGGPSKRSDTAMSFDPVRGVLVLYGGTSETGDSLSDTWEMSGGTWTLRASAGDAGPRREHGMAFDPVSKRTLAVGGRDAFASSTTYAWDGTTWSLVANDLSMTRPKLVTHVDASRVQLMGSTGMYEWSGSGWTRVFSPVQGGVHRGRLAAAVDLDERRMLVFGGYLGSAPTNTTEIWRGAWTEYTGTSPPARGFSAMAYDAARREFVLFGGTELNGAVGDTWVFDGVWTQRTPAVSPPARASHSMVYDAKRKVVVLFGGNAATRFGDTWTWDGTTWTEVPGAGPPARSDHAATYDPIREETLVFGGFQGGGQVPFGDTWAWTGTWSKRNDTGPTPRFSTGMAWDAPRRRVVLFGGSNGQTNEFGDVWEWDGTAWTQVAATAIAARSGHTLQPSLDGTGVLRFGITSLARDEVALLRWNASDPQEACVVGEDFDADGNDAPICGGGDPDCWRVCAPECPPGTSCPAMAIGCGDGVCTDGRETCRSCPADCGACPAACGDLACNGGETHATCVADCP